MTHPDAPQAVHADSFVLCELAGTTYALPSDAIEQLDMPGAVTPVPNVPAFVDGITSIRGRVIPAVSLRARFGVPRVAPDARTRIVVVRSGARSVGLIVDAAREFAKIPADAIQPPPETLVDDTMSYLRGVAHLGDRLILVLDTAELLRSSDPMPAALPDAPSGGALPAAFQPYTD